MKRFTKLILTLTKKIRNVIDFFRGNIKYISQCDENTAKAVVYLEVFTFNLARISVY